MPKFLIYDKINEDFAFNCDTFTKKQAKKIIKRISKRYTIKKIPRKAVKNMDNFAPLLNLIDK